MILPASSGSAVGRLREVLHHHALRVVPATAVGEIASERTEAPCATGHADHEIPSVDLPDHIEHFLNGLLELGRVWQVVLPCDLRQLVEVTPDPSEVTNQGVIELRPTGSRRR